VLHLGEGSHAKPGQWLAVLAEAFPGILQFLMLMPGLCL
jgi:hypothetical protein